MIILSLLRILWLIYVFIWATSVTYFGSLIGAAGSTSALTGGTDQSVVDMCIVPKLETLVALRGAGEVACDRTY